VQFLNRKDARQQLAQLLLHYKDEVPIVLGLPRGGVPVAYEVSKALQAPLDVWVVPEVAERVQRLRGSLPNPRLEAQTVTLVDDGIATGGTVRSAVQASTTCFNPRRSCDTRRNQTATH
jgi:putative phosphoribosyl transferase